ncbi:MAG: TetR/AcrR family transcriptional regulator [Sphingomicrobium sp.]
MQGLSQRERLTVAAARRFHKIGLRDSTIADVAHEAGIPTGNVYYHFRSKDALALAVLDYWHARTSAARSEIEAGHRGGAARIAAFLAQARRNAVTYVDLGCPLAALVRDFQGVRSETESLAGDLLKRQIQWLSAQFRDSGLAKREASREAVAMLVRIQGGIGLAYALKSKKPLLAAISDAEDRLADLTGA